METETVTTIELIYSASRQFYLIPMVRRECMIWLSVEKYPLPVPPEWHRPGTATNWTIACVLRGRDYYRIGCLGLQHQGPIEAVEPDNQLALDYRDAAWWTPGLEEAWLECARLAGENAALTNQLEELTAPAAREKVKPRAR